MLRSLGRTKFVDRNWGREDLELLAKFWLHIYQGRRPSSGEPLQFQQALEIRLTGFPRSAAAGVSTELARRLPAAGVPVEVSTPDADTVVAKTNPRPGTEPPFAGLGIPALAGAPFDGLVVEIRFTVVEAGVYRRSTGLLGTTFVTVGELRNGVVAVKSVWVDTALGRNPWENAPNADDFLLAAFDRFRSRNEVSEDLARAVLIRSFREGDGPDTRSLKQRLHDFLNPPFGRPRLRALLVRCVVLSLLFVAAFATIAVQMLRGGGGPVFFLVVLPLSFLVMLHFPIFLVKELRVFWPTYRQTRAFYDWRFSVPESSPALPAGERREWFDDPTVRKYTAELTAAGFVHAGDAAAVSEAVGAAASRVFFAPDGRTYLVLILVFQTEPGPAQVMLWPARCSALCRTFFTTEGRCDTINFMSYAQRLGRDGPAVRLFIRPRSTHPVDLYAEHLRELERCRVEDGVSVHRHESLAGFLVRYEQVAVQRREAYARRPYSWRDHIRWYLQLDADPSEDRK